jgi:ADP-dependent NAD(P)H-hydrate dehydratase / NAD(P)H-hydrate epimerase
LRGIFDAQQLYTAAQSRELDRCAIEDFGQPGIVLMSRAATAAFEWLLALWPDVEQVHVLCGTGNNGGDGYLLADLAHKRRISVTVYQLGDVDRIQGDAALARAQALDNGVAVQAFSPENLQGGVIVDAMLGTGLGGEVRAPFLGAIEAVNSSELPVLAVDVPSGLCGDTGRVLGTAVRADVTVCFIGLKRGLFTGDAPDYTGLIQFTDLQIPAEVYQRVTSDCARLELEPLLEAMPGRPASAHKGLYGSVLIIGGDYGMAGAVAMAAEAAIRCGAGLVNVATRPEHVSSLVARTPEVMSHGVNAGEDLAPLIDRASVLVVGPGLGQSNWSEQVMAAALESTKPMVLDADGLNLLAAGKLVASPRRQDWILTPHPGEAARLLGVGTSEIQGDRFAAATQIQQRYGGVAVLKGNGTLVASEGCLVLGDYGNPGMASGGMGDVLSGVIGALYAQHLPAEDAAALAICLHGAAADLAAEDGERGLVATDLIPRMRALLG